MIAALFVAAVQQMAAEKPLRFGAHVETLSFSGALESVAFDADGPVLLPSSSPSVRCIVRAPDGRRFSTVAGDDRIRVESGPDSTWFSARGKDLGQLRKPAGLALDRREKGRLVVADTLNHRIAVFDLDGKPITAFGRLGAGEGELNHPLDVAVDASGAVFVADAGNDRIVKFDADGKFVKSFGGRGSYPGLFRHPTGLDVHGEQVYVADRDNHRIQVFDLTGEFVYEWGVSALLPREGNGKLHDPSDVAVTPKGDRVAVIEPMEDRIQIFGPARDDTLMTSPEGDTGVHFGGFPSVRRDVFAVANPMGPYVSIFDLTIGTPVEITKFGRPGNGPGRMLRPVSVLLDEKAERVFVADPYAYTISAYRIARKPDEALRFDPFLAHFERALDLRAASAVNAYWPVEPGGMALGKNGEIFVADEANQRVVVLDRDLVALRSVEAGVLYPPLGLALEHESGTLAVTGNVVLPPALANRELLESEFSFRKYGSVSGLDIHCGPPAAGAAFNSKGELLTVETENDRVLRWLQKFFNHFPAIGRRGVGKAEFCKPEGIAVDERDLLYVVDSGNHRFQILDREGRYLDMFGARFYTEAARIPPLAVRQPNAWDGAKSVRTVDSSWRIAWKPRDGTIERGKPFTIDAWVFEPGEPGRASRFVELRLDAYMPEHLHGMNRVPKVSKRDDGGFTIEGVLLHMSGFWELDFDVTSKGVTERATTRIDLE